MDDSSPFKFRWPQTGDTLLSLGNDVRFSNDVKERKYRLLLGYKLASDVLIDHALSNDRESNNLIFPILFNYRHYIEIALKFLIERHSKFTNVFLPKKYNHNLEALWEIFETISIIFQENPTNDAAQAVKECIQEFDKYKSDFWRYATTGNNEFHSISYDGLDLRNLRSAMNGIENFFDGADMAFDEKEQAAYASRFD